MTCLEFQSAAIQARYGTGSRRRFLTFVLLLAGSLSGAPTGSAQQPQPAAPSQAPAASSSSAGQVRGYTLPPGKEAQAVAYARSEHELYFIDFAYGLLVLVLLLRLRVAPAFRDWAERAGGGNFSRTAIFTALIFPTIDILTLPSSIWRHHLSLQYQQSIQGWGSWLLDWLKGEAVSCVIAVLVLWILYAAIRKSARRWWLIFWLAAVPLILLGAVVEPLVIEPLFFKFTPLAKTEPHLAARIEEVAGRAGLAIPESRMFEMNASSKLKAINAYVSGIGATRRVVVWDTALRKMTEDEILFVFGHEMGHYVLGHVLDGILFTCVVLLVFLYLAYRLLGWMLARWGETWAIRGASDLASLPALLLLLSIFNFLFTPISNAYSRHLEHQADQYGLEVIHGIVPDVPGVAARAFQILGEVDLEEPNPSTAVKFWFYNHPPLNERMRFAETYDPWSQGCAPEFVKRGGSSSGPSK
ncbi:MAG: M48 family metallopeptidase [Candidatus Acidiferrales bacterium]